MRNSVVYLLDTNVFVEAAKRYYAFDLAPSFWRSLADQAKRGKIRSIDRVKAELDGKDDKLKEWASSAHLFEATSEEDLKQYGKIMNWAVSANFKEKAKKDLAGKGKADAWVVAHAMAKGYAVVTHEQYMPRVRRKIPVPNVCRAFGVRNLDTFQMLRELGIRLG